MPTLGRKRRAPEDEDDATPTPAYDDHDDGEVSYAEQDADSGSGSIEQLSKNLVRYALACEYSRAPIKRQDITQKVLGTYSRSFRPVFDHANAQLMDVFGMQLVELPLRDKVTMRQKRAAIASESQVKNSNIWVLVNILAEPYRQLDFMAPGPEPPEHVSDINGAYVGLYTTVIALILLSGGSLSENKLDRYLRRMNAADTTPVDTTEKVLARMIKDGYIVKVKDSTGGDEVVDYIVGSRGKVEVGKEGVANFVRKVYGADVEDLEERLSRSLGLSVEENAADASTQPATGPGRRANGQR